MKRWIRSAFVIAVCAGIAAALAGCGALQPKTGDDDRSLPPRIEAEFPQITKATVTAGLDGFTRYLSVGVIVKDAEAVDADFIRDLFVYLREAKEQPSVTYYSVTVHIGEVSNTPANVAQIRQELNASVGGDPIFSDFDNEGNDWWKTTDEGIQRLAQAR